MTKVHLIGIGGVGISALARLYLQRGYDISGTNDQPSQKTLGGLEEKGVTIYYTPDKNNIDADTDLIVYSNAWPKNFPEFIEEVKALGIKTLSYPQALGEITSEYTTVCVAGTHGKTTTTAMLLHVLSQASLSPTGIVGSMLTSGTNFVAGNSNILVIEADEYMKAFLNHHPAIVGVTNIDHDHHDIYPTLDDMKQAFRELAENLPETGILVCSALDQNSWDAFDDLERNVVDYSNVDVSDLELLVPGEFNKRNASLAIALASLLGVEEGQAKEFLKTFKGTWRRQEFKGKTTNDQLVFDDYAHHPTEIAAVIAGFKDKYPDKKITVIFQPHLFSRTRELFDEFVSTFKNVQIHQLILVPVYAAREAFDKTASSQKIIEELSEINAIYAPDFEEAINQIDQESEIIITMGAGDITEISDRLVV